MSGRGVELAYAAGWKLVRLMPAGLARWVFRAVADQLTRRGGRGVWQLTRNLRRVVGPGPSEEELSGLVRDGMRSYARYWLEAFRLPAVSPETMTRTFHLTTPELLDTVTGGCVLALPHAANWEHAGVWATSQGIRLTAVAERLQPEGLYQRFVAYRQRLGMEILPTRGPDRATIDTLADRLRDGGVVALLADRDMSSRGVPVTFFGHPTRMPPGPALLAIQTGRPLIVVSLWFGDDGTYAKLTGPLPVPAEGTLPERVAMLTQRVADELAAGIAAHPADWHMLSRLWLDDRHRTTSPPTDGAPVDTDPAASAPVGADPAADATTAEPAGPVARESGRDTSTGVR
ncbi:lipid A biosynthesis lauroyl acyltransferase [Actinocatenispora thailandica]|uniref:Lipid A biosynthesis lauroyl acyltransferase n=1 Tax=Actinocatenispora thailandica TaxID=227318 RepID=A0A7R7DPQ5_9ACTN|nr:phosphatidylinositol mannoside acyltransferase [Actinocatenispora thailandica]BCJ35252.1 lipid A biosynthesis lauroyl acyltransferase [Actinocatenispora thailandica]